MDDIRGSSAGRRLSQIFDPIARLASDFGSSSSAPCSPRLGLNNKTYENASVFEANKSRGNNTTPDNLTHENTRLLSRQRSGSTTRQVSILPSNRSQQLNDSPVHSRSLTSTYVNVPCDNLHHGRRDKSFTDNNKSNIGYVELRSKDNKSHYHGVMPPPFSFSSESSGCVEYADKRNLYENKSDNFSTYDNFENDSSSDASSPLFENIAGEGGSSLSSNVDRILSAFGGSKQQQFRRASIDRDVTFNSSMSPATTASDEPRERFDGRNTAYSSSKSFDAGFSATVENLNWQERCLELQIELHRSRSQATRVRDMLREKLSELEQRVLDAEGRADEAEDKVRMMEERLVKGEYSLSTSGVGSPAHSLASTSGTQNDKIEEVHCACISKLETQVEEQRQLRLQDAKQVEAKAARIKEWVTNKLRELEQQNQHLREQNNKCNQQLELLRNHITNIGLRPLVPATRASLSLEVDQSLRRRSESLETTPQVISENVNQTTTGDFPQIGIRHRRHLSACGTIHQGITSSNMDSSLLSEELAAAVENLVADGGLGIGPSTNEDTSGVPSSTSNTTSSKHSHTAGHNLTTHNSQGYCDISVPVYATVKGRASQIRSMPFGDSSDDSSDGEEHANPTETNTRITNSSSDNTDSSLGSGSSPSKSIKTTSSLSPAKRSSSGSPSKSVKRDISLESGLSEDYAIPPDALSSTSIESSMPSLLMRVAGESPKKLESLEKAGHLAKLGGKLKTWRKRWFVLKNGTLMYWKSQNDVNRKPQGQVILDDVCRINRADGAATFEISTGKKTYYLTADCIATMEDWIRVLQNVQRRNATKLLLSREDNKPTIQGWLTKNPIGQINMRDARVEEVEHVSDSDSEERDAECPHERTIGIFPTHQGPTYLLMPHKQDKDNWLYHLTVVSGGGPNAGTQYEQLVQRLMETDGDSSCVLWRHPLLLHTKENITSPLTSLTSEALQSEAIKLFKACQLFMSVAVEQAGIDYHVVLAQNALQQCLDQPELQTEFICALVKQTSRHTHQRLGVQVKKAARLVSLSTARVGHSTSNILDCKTNPAQYVLVQGWQLLALAVSLFLPRNNRLLWYLKLHLQRNADSKTECGKYAAYCERALERTLQNGGREVKPSRMEVLSILLKNPYHHSLPHAIPVHFLNGTYQVVSFDGSTTIEEFLHTLNQEIGCRDAHQSGFTLFSDDPIEKDLEHFIDLQAKLCDIISKWETALREKGSGKFENTRVIQLTYKSRCYWRSAAKMETDRERLLLCYQVNQQVVQGKFPLNRDLAFELASLMAQIDFGEYNNDKIRGSGPANNPSHLILQAVTLLELQSMAVMYRYNYANIITFGGCLDDFMLVACPDEGVAEQKLIFVLSKPKILEITLLIADYMNALGHTLPGTPQMNTLTRNGSHRSIKSTMRHTTGSSCLPTQPDILKSTPDHQRP
ncbi:GSCOCG00004909001-RA-CDS [Cotesia congregata]|nr:GSCOCG00004909001-RA-CDS [Cotesia congregata]